MSDVRARVEGLLGEHRGVLVALVRHEARGLLRFEAEEDLLQGIRQRVLEKADVYEDRGDEAALGWLRTVARHWLHGRRAHWSALKRDGGALVRFTLGASTAGVDGSGTPPAGVPLPADTWTGPATVADRLEQLTLATRALDLLLERDRDLVRWSCEGLELHEMAERLEISYEASERARLRAQQRLRKAYRLVSGG